MSTAPPSLEQLNARARAGGLCAGSGLPLRFIAPDARDIPYEQRIWQRGEVLTRPDNWHDACNAQVWLEFPRAKATLNRRHIEAMVAATDGRRGRVRDRITQFDECGVVITGMPADIWQALRAHRWREVFVGQRRLLREQVCFHLFGHASRDALRAPFVGLCGKALWLDTSPDAIVSTDVALASWLLATDFAAPWQPLPLLGIPGITPDSEQPGYYDDLRQFRPARRISAGKSARQSLASHASDKLEESPGSTGQDAG